jgi:hypothetical protein
VAGVGRISLLVSKELQTLAQAIRGLDKEMSAQLRKHTKLVVGPVWQESVRGNVTNRLQTRVLSDSATVAVSDQNVMLRSGGIGRLSSGLPKSEIAFAAEFGANRDSTEEVVSSKGKRYQRHTRRQFKYARPRGYVVYPAASEIIPRIASLWVQTMLRTTHEKFEEGGAS